MAAEDTKLLARAKPYWGLGISRDALGPYSYSDILEPGYPLCAPLDYLADRYEVRVADQEARQVGDGESGEIQVRGYALTPGLHKVEREEYFTPDGFYHTGDMGLVEGSRIHFIGRNGDMIKTASANVSPAEVEMEMQALEGVHSAYVVGIPDESEGNCSLLLSFPGRRNAELRCDSGDTPPEIIQLQGAACLCRDQTRRRYRCSTATRCPDVSWRPCWRRELDPTDEQLDRWPWTGLSRRDRSQRTVGRLYRG